MAAFHKHIISSSSSLVVDALVGVSASNPNAVVDKQHKVLYLAEPDRSRVAIISGGGAGHEPAHSGFVGEGMLTAAVCGDVFASPNANQVKRALQLVENDKGTLMVVKSYTGDILNFGLAREQYCAANPSKINSLKFVVVGDDVSVGKKQGEIVGRRGLAGTVLVYKIAGALAQRGASLEDVHRVAQFAADRLGTIAVGLEHCHVPGTESGSTHLKDDEIEVGMGIHNESGHSRVRPIPALPDLVDKLLGYLFATPETDEDRAFLPWPKRGASRNCVLLVNNLGGLSALELSSAAKTIAEKINKSGVNIERILVGTYMTSLNMPGFSVTLLLLPQPDESDISKEQLLQLLDAPAKTPAWTWTSGAPPRARFSTSDAQTEEPTSSHKKDNAPASNQFADSVRQACNALIQAEIEITQMDQIVGDGDCGTTLKAGAEAVLNTLNKPEFGSYGAVGSISQIGQIVGDAMGGTSGALYSIYLSALAQGLQGASTNNSGEPTREQYAEAAAFALERLYTYTRARPPSRTLVDPLAAFVESLKDPGVNLGQAFETAQRAAEDTKNLPARAGRAAYVNAEAVKGTCDPGAWGIRCLLQGLLKGASK
ncbi:dihydroxyacetone kinase [Rhizoctonia solani AG-3 Rhs1AP]|uniref:Dihydroxyacetone kinase n=1 Tax=Rhizoctonia solani AG-3 Rhs1AP TaxID=1086054 RepID=A0A0A1UJ58_9AGAM|nr:dihydroxyacetone kinase [Rhizoctonia solani AG-3 Rhs1AP]